MTTLHESLRKQLEKTVVKARDVAEEGAAAALGRLGVGGAKAYDGLTAADRDLRTRLRARGRQIGDARQPTGEQAVGRLTGELAYEYWHRMLFARFLAENDLLMHPDGVSVSLADCEELAREEGLANGWLLAERYASRMLPEIFRPADPLLQVPFAPEHEHALEQLLEALPAEAFRASDALGWVYQFWQARKKDEVNKSGVKIGADELPAVTQLFTEPYMVHFLLDNTLGAWWTGRHPGEAPPVAFEYLRLLEDGTPAAGTFDGWPKRAAELKVLDPCCGSGHFLVAALLKLVPMRKREEGLTAREAVDAVLRDNLHGLEIDPRCTQIAAFAVALAAWSYSEIGYRVLPALSIACSGTALHARREEWLDLAGQDAVLRAGLDRLFTLFQQSETLGSLIDPREARQGDVLSAGLEDVRHLLVHALTSEHAQKSANTEAAGVTAQGLLLAAGLLEDRYSLVITNVPYLARGKQSRMLQDYCEAHFEEAKQDLATVFFERCKRLCTARGTSALVAPQNWLYLDAYTQFRQGVLKRGSWHLAARLGANAFESITGEVVNVGLFVYSNTHPPQNQDIATLDVVASHSATAKASALQLNDTARVRQLDQLKNPDFRITLEVPQTGESLQDYASFHNGLQTGDYVRFGRFFWELPDIAPSWRKFQSTVSTTAPWGGLEQIVRWGTDANPLDGNPGAVIRGSQAWGKCGVAVSAMGALNVSLYSGELYDDNVVVIVPNNERDLAAIWAFCSHPEYRAEVRRIDQALKVRSALIKVPFDISRWSRAASNNVLDQVSDDVTQWPFHGDIQPSTAPLQVACARLVGYCWPNARPDGLSRLSDDDGIVGLQPVSGERSAADRLLDVLAVSYGSRWNTAQQDRLLVEAGSRSTTLTSWLQDDFFTQHCEAFEQRPFIWQIWDGRKDGFSALVNYHKLDRHTLTTLTYTYLGDWIARQEADAKANKAGGDLRLAAARGLQKKLELILEGEPPYNIFVRWKPMERQPIGWEPDLNDGVRVNIRPFMTAGVLRSKPSIKWGKDRGKNPPGSPWGEERFNSYEEYSGGKLLTNAMKQSAREKAAKKGGR